MKKRELIQLLDKEIQWCIEHPDDAFPEEYRKGFINGLIQAKYLISAASRRTMDKNKSYDLSDANKAAHAILDLRAQLRKAEEKNAVLWVALNRVLGSYNNPGKVVSIVQQALEAESQESPPDWGSDG